MLELSPLSSIGGELRVPGDKSISHRALILSALAKGETQIRGLLDSEDVRSTLRALVDLGVKISQTGDLTRVQGVGLRGFQPPVKPLDAGNSGTTMRLLMGLLSAQPFDSILIGDASLSRRPMERVAGPLRRMGARIELNEGKAPIRIFAKNGALAPCTEKLSVASAQLKSALLLASLYSSGESQVEEPSPTRDHTERMLTGFGVSLKTCGTRLLLTPPSQLKWQKRELQIPGDFSSASYFVAMALLAKGNGDLLLRGVGLNPTRLGFLHVLARMGADLEVSPAAEDSSSEFEPWGDLHVRASTLQGTEVTSAEVPLLIDELPLLAVLATQANGVTRVGGAGELRVKESDRIAQVVSNLRAMGVAMEELPDGFSVEGPQDLSGGIIRTMGDHRLAMAFACARMVAMNSLQVDHPESVSISYPRFFQDQQQLARGGDL